MHEAGSRVRDQSRSVANQLGAEVAELELGQPEDPKKLVYGSVAKIREQVSHLTDFKTSFEAVGNGLKGLGEPDGLKGASAEAFRRAVAKEPRSDGRGWAPGRRRSPQERSLPAVAGPTWWRAATGRGRSHACTSRASSAVLAPSGSRRQPSRRASGWGLPHRWSARRAGPSCAAEGAGHRLLQDRRTLRSGYIRKRNSSPSGSSTSRTSSTTGPSSSSPA
ncbi:putative T7SS-secreted protein [Streptomyces virginiae]|uniref:putative T7SS-secreted protein n=1 Tax=Streptomyces virginiae TaxID=1961 RepID=UPI00343BF901